MVHSSEDGRLGGVGCPHGFGRKGLTVRGSSIIITIIFSYGALHSGLNLPIYPFIY